MGSGEGDAVLVGVGKKDLRGVSGEGGVTRM